MLAQGLWISSKLIRTSDLALTELAFVTTLAMAILHLGGWPEIRVPLAAPGLTLLACASIAPEPHQVGIEMSAARALVRRSFLSRS